MQIFLLFNKIPRFNRLFVFLWLPLIFTQSVTGQITPEIKPASILWGELSAGNYEVGFKILKEKDAARSFYKKTGDTIVLSDREIKISIWYPSRQTKPAKEGQKRMKFAEYLTSTLFTGGGEKAMNSAKNFVKTPLLDELSDAARKKLLDTETAATFEVPYLTGNKFPIVVFGQGLYYESPVTHTILCEFLASRGFIVATTELVGAHSPFVKLEAVDLEAAVRDLEFVAARVKRLEAANPEKTAIVGFDMGGLAGLIYAMRNPGVRAYASLDSGITAEHNLRLVRQMPDYEPLRLSVPLLQATHPVVELMRFNVREDASFLDEAVRSERLVLRFPDTRHADFTSIPMIEWTIAERRDERAAHRRRSFETAAQALLAFLMSHLKGDAKSREALYGQAGDALGAVVGLTKELKPAGGSSGISENEFLNRLYWDGAENAIRLYRRLRLGFPNETIFREVTLDQIGYNRLYRGDAEEAIRIFSLNLEAFPNSANAYGSLADAYRLTGDKVRAIYNYKRSLELNPLNQLIKERLKQIEAGDASK